MKIPKVAVLVVLPVLAGCLGAVGPEPGADADAAPVGDAAPAWTLPDEIAGIQLETNVDGVEAAAGIRASGDRLYVSGSNTGFYVLDVGSPTRPEVLGHLASSDVGYNRDVALLEVDGRTVAVLARSGDGMSFVDVTDPANMTILAEGYLGGGPDADGSNGNVHNVAVVPNSTVVYNSRSADTPGVDVVDASDPTDPERVDVFGDLTCHDVAFWAEGERAYCAGVRETQIWDVSDPLQPEVAGRIVNPLINIHHQAFPMHDGSLLVITDEFAGSTAAAYGCGAYAEPGDRPVSDPVGAAWFYDISDESRPEPISYVAPPAPTGNDQGMAPCTAHFGTPIEDRDRLILGWRTAGTWLVGIEDVEQPRLLDGFGDGTEVWEARYHRGHVYTGDTARGTDVIGLVGP